MPPPDGTEPRAARQSIRAGGLALVVGALAFVGVFSYLAARFDYPEILDGRAADVLPRLLATGSTGRLVWAVYAFLPLLFLPAGVGAYMALKRVHRGAMLLALEMAVVAALAMMLGLMRWPSVHWHLAALHAGGTPEQQQTVAAVFDGLNTYLGNYIGEFLGELCLNAFALLSSWSLLRTGNARGTAVVGLATGVAGLVGMLRNVTAAVAPVAEVNNYLLPLWMIAFGAVLIRYRMEPAHSGGAREVAE